MANLDDDVLIRGVVGFLVGFERELHLGPGYYARAFGVLLADPEVRFLPMVEAEIARRTEHKVPRPCVRVRGGDIDWD